MKPSNEWLNIARRGALIAISAFFVVALSGCFHDEDDKIPKLWDISWYGTDNGEITVNVPISNLNNLSSYNATIDTFTIDIVVTAGTPATIDITITDSASQFELNMSGTIAADGESATGTYNGLSDNGTVISGGWDIFKK